MQFVGIKFSDLYHTIENTTIQSTVKPLFVDVIIQISYTDFLIGWFVPRVTGLWQNNLLDVIIVV